MSFFAIYPAISGGGGGGGGITSINGDTTAAQLIVGGSGISVGTAGGTTTISATGAGTGTVTSVDVSGGATGLTTSGGPVTTSGTITIAGALNIGHGGTNSTTALNNNRIMVSSGGAIVEEAAITANRALASNASGLPVASATTDTELGYVSGVTSSIQTQLNGKQATLTLGNLTDAGTDGIVVTGGTGAVVGAGTSIAQHVADASHNGYLSSADWSSFNSKQPAGSYITDLTGDVTATGPGSAAASLVATSNATLTTLSGLTTASSLASIGTITSGTWNATTIAINHGGTGQTTASAAFGALSPLTTKGDLLSFSTVNARLPVGSDGQVLTADSGQTLGVKWATPSVSNASLVWVNTGTGSASTNTAIATFLTVVTNTGTDITYTSDTTNGDSFTINADGVYAMSHTNLFNSAAHVGISLNATQLSTSIESITSTDALTMETTGNNDYSANVGVTMFLHSGDVIRPHCENAFVQGADNARAKFIIQRVS